MDNGHLDSKKKKLGKESRGTIDELEVIKLILADEPLLLRKVRDKIKFLLARSSDNVVDASKKKYDEKKG